MSGREAERTQPVWAASCSSRGRNGREREAKALPHRELHEAGWSLEAPPGGGGSRTRFGCRFTHTHITHYFIHRPRSPYGFIRVCVCGLYMYIAIMLKQWQPPLAEVAELGAFSRPVAAQAARPPRSPSWRKPRIDSVPCRSAFNCRSIRSHALSIPCSNSQCNIAAYAMCSSTISTCRCVVPATRISCSSASVADRQSVSMGYAP